jgi:hypothetical protein
MKQVYTRITTVLFNYFTLTGTLLFIACCATPPPMLEEPVKRNWEVAEPLETVWSAMVQSLVDKGVIISILDKEDHLIVAEEILEEGNIRNLIAERGSLESGMARITLLLTEKSESRTRIQINCVIQGYTGRYNVYATSNGNLEKDYFFSITNNLPTKKSYEWLEEEKEEGDDLQKIEKQEIEEEVKTEGATSQELP